MKKQYLLPIFTVIAMVLASCGGSNEVKKANLKTQEDSLNYALGLVMSEEIYMNALQNDSSEKTISLLVNKIEKYYNDENNNKVHKMGIKIGNMIKQQKSTGLYGDSTLVFNDQLFEMGIMKGIKGDTTGITAAQALVYFQNTIQKKQTESKMKANAVSEFPADTINN